MRPEKAQKQEIRDKAKEIAIHCAHAKMVPVAELKPHPRNSNTHSENQIALLAKIIGHQGWRSPIVVSNRSGFIVAGHGRLEAAKLLQVESVPVDYQNFSSETDELTHLIADNRIAELAELDNATLKDLLVELNKDGFDLDLTGFDSGAMEIILGEIELADAEPQIDRADELVQKMFTESARLLKPGCCCCCCCGGGGGPDPQFARWSLWLDEKIPFKMCVVWDKGGLGMGWHYRRNWECILVAQQPGAGSKWYGGNDVPNVIRDIGKIIPTADDHPTPKPIELPAWFLRLHSQPGDIVFEPFSGGGSTLIACENLKRRCFAMEISPAYVAVALQRWADVTGKKPTLIHA